MAPKKFLDQAARFALTTSLRGEGGPFGAVVTTKDGRVIAVSANSVLRDQDPTCHAEINAIRKACRRIKNLFLEGCTVYSTTEPCPMCFSALHWARVERVVYSTTIGDVAKLGFNELSVSNKQMKKWGKSPLKIERVNNADCKRLLIRWKRNSDRQIY